MAILGGKKSTGLDFGRATGRDYQRPKGSQGRDEPGIRHLMPHVLEMGVAYVVKTEHEAVLVFGDGVPDVLE